MKDIDKEFVFMYGILASACIVLGLFLLLNAMHKRNSVLECVKTGQSVNVCEKIMEAK